MPNPVVVTSQPPINVVVTPQAPINVVVTPQPPINVEVRAAAVVNIVGGNAGSSMPLLPAAQPLSALRVVSRVGANYDYATPLTPESVWAIAGITADAVSIGVSFAPIRDGPMTDNAWLWTLGLPIFLGPNGTLTQSPPIVGYAVVIATPQSSKTVIINIQEPIKL
jgi:hypothetical protein